MDDGPSTSFDLKPSAGYFVADNFVVGLMFGVNSTPVKGEDAPMRLALAPQIGYSFPVPGNARPFIKALPSMRSGIPETVKGPVPL